MTNPAPRRRARGMSPDQRRAMIIATALPLIAEHGSAVTTSRIAGAAGIGEATLFRAFRDKDELMQACIAEVLRPDHVLDAVASIPLEQPLADRLTEAATALDAHLARIATVLGALRTTGGTVSPLPVSGWPRDAGARSDDGPTAPDREASLRAVVDAVAGLLGPGSDTLRLPPEQVAGLFVGQLFARGRPRPLVGPVLPAAQLVDLFLHGALAGADAA